MILSVQFFEGSLFFQIFKKSKFYKFICSTNEFNLKPVYDFQNLIGFINQISVQNNKI